MSTRTSTPNAEERAWSYWFADGLPNLLAGLTCLLISAGFLLLLRIRSTHSPMIAIVGGMSVGIAWLLVFRLRQTLEWLKSRITYPRTGYAAPPYFTFRLNEPAPADLIMLNLSGAEKSGILPSALDIAREVEDRHRLLWLMLATYGAALVCAQFISDPWIGALLGTATGLGMWATTRKNDRKSWVVAFGLPFTALNLFVLAGCFVRQFHVDRLAFFLAGAGLILAVLGAVTLAKYLRRNPAARA